MVLNSHVSSWRPLIDCEDIKSLTSCNYTVNRKICKKLGLSYYIVNEYLKDLVDLIDDSNCPKEVFDVFSSVFINYVPDLLSKNRGIFNKCKGDDYRFEKAIEKYNNYKKSGCYIEVVK